MDLSGAGVNTGALYEYQLTPPITPFAINQGSNNRTTGVHTGDGDFLWKQYQPIHSVESIHYECKLLLWLGKQELTFAVPTPVQTRDGDFFCTLNGTPHALFPLIPGTGLNYAEPRQLENTGVALAELHRILSRFPIEPRPAIESYGQLAKVHPAITQPSAVQPVDLGLSDSEPFASLLAWWREEVATLQNFIDGTYRTLPRQVIHGDFTPSNTLHADGQLTGIVDFEFACPDVRALDVAAGLYFSLRLWEQGAFWQRAEAFAQGYAGQLEMTDIERSALSWLMRLRNGVSKIFWLGRSLTDGTTKKQVLDMEELQSFNRWLETNRNRLERVFEQ